MQFQTFLEKGRANFDDCLKSVLKNFGKTSREGMQWQKWAEKIPSSDDVEEFVER